MFPALLILIHNVVAFWLWSCYRELETTVGMTVEIMLLVTLLVTLEALNGFEVHKLTSGFFFGALE